MSTPKSIYNNYARFECEGQVDLSAAGAVSAYRGDGLTVTKNGTGLYDIVVVNPGEHVHFETLNTWCDIQDSALGTIKQCSVVSLTQSSTTGDWTLIVRTEDAAGAAADEATNALTLSFGFVARINRMTQPFA